MYSHKQTINLQTTELMTDCWGCSHTKTVSSFHFRQAKLYRTWLYLLYRQTSLKLLLYTQWNYTFIMSGDKGQLLIWEDISLSFFITYRCNLYFCEIHVHMDTQIYKVWPLWWTYKTKFECKDLWISWPVKMFLFCAVITLLWWGIIYWYSRFHLM